METDIVKTTTEMFPFNIYVKVVKTRSKHKLSRNEPIRIIVSESLSRLPIKTVVNVPKLCLKTNPNIDTLSYRKTKLELFKRNNSLYNKTTANNKSKLIRYKSQSKISLKPNLELPLLCTTRKKISFKDYLVINFFNMRIFIINFVI